MNFGKKLNIPLILGVVFVLILGSISILLIKRNLTLSKVQASPGSTCTVSDSLEVTGNFQVSGTTNIFVPTRPWATVDCAGWDSSDDTCNFGGAFLGYSAIVLAVAPDVASDVLNVEFYDSGDIKLGEIRMGTAACSSVFGSWYRSAHTTVILPISAEYAKIRNVGGCVRGEEHAQNIIIMGLIK